MWKTRKKQLIFIYEFDSFMKYYAYVYYTGVLNIQPRKNLMTTSNKIIFVFCAVLRWLCHKENVYQCGQEKLWVFNSSLSRLWLEKMRRKMMMAAATKAWGIFVLRSALFDWQGSASAVCENALLCAAPIYPPREMLTSVLCGNMWCVYMHVMWLCWIVH